MRVFLSYASEQRPLAEHVCRVLESEGLDVFFDREDLAPGDAYGARIRRSVEQSHLFVFLVCRDSIAPQSYARTELAIVETIPPRRRPQILPVLVEPVDLAQLPALIKPVTLLEPQGNLAAEVAARIGDVRAALKRRKLRLTAAAVVFPVAIVAGIVAWSQRDARETPDAAEQLNQSVQKKTPADTRVRLTGMLSNSGWMLNVQIVGFSTKEISYRLDGDTSFRTLGVMPNINPMTGLPMANTMIVLAGPAWKEHDLAVRYVDNNGNEFGPYAFHFDPKAEYVRETKDLLVRVIPDWLSFREYPKGRMLVYFSSLLSHKNAFREIHYSVDSDDLGKSVKFVQDWSGSGSPSSHDDDETYVTIPMTARYVAVKLTYIDGTTSELKRFVLSEVGIERN